MSRGGHILEAAAGPVAEQGVAGISMRRVATAARVSLAQVQYYFHSRAELVAAVFDHAGDEFVAALGGLLDGEPSPDRFRAIVWEWVPLDTTRERRARIWLAYAAVAAVDEQLAPDNARLDAQLRDWFTQQLHALDQAGLVAEQINPTAASAQLLALLDGVTVHALTLPMAEREPLAQTVLGDWLDRLVPTYGNRGAD